jgi:hypothetical protein
MTSKWLKLIHEKSKVKQVWYIDTLNFILEQKKNMDFTILYLLIIDILFNTNVNLECSKSHY